MLGRIKRPKCEKVMNMYFLFIVSIICCMIMPCVMAQQEGQSAWNWSVKTGDVQQLNNKNFIPTFYMPSDSVNISWSITPAKTPKTDITNAQLWIYPAGTDISNIKPLMNITPVGQNYTGYKYISVEYYKGFSG